MSVGSFWITENICSISLLEVFDSSSAHTASLSLAIFFMLASQSKIFFVIVVPIQWNARKLYRFLRCWTIFFLLCLLKFGHITFLRRFLLLLWMLIVDDERRQIETIRIYADTHCTYFGIDCLPMWLSLCANIVEDVNNSNQIGPFAWYTFPWTVFLFSFRLSTHTHSTRVEFPAGAENVMKIWNQNRILASSMLNLAF